MTCKMTLIIINCLTYRWGPAVVGGALQCAKLSSTKHGRINRDLHTLLAVELHLLLFTDNLTFIFICEKEKYILTDKLTIKYSIYILYIYIK